MPRMIYIFGGRDGVRRYVHMYMVRVSISFGIWNWKSGNLQRLRKRWEEREGENDIPAIPAIPAIGMVFVIIPVKMGVTDGGGSSSLRFGGGEGGSPWALKCTQRFLRPFAGKEMCLLCRGVFGSRGGEPPQKTKKRERRFHGCSW